MSGIAALNKGESAQTGRVTPRLPGFLPGKRADMGSVLSFKRNDTIVDEGEAGRFSWRIVNGMVRQCVLLADGRRQILDFLSAGDIFGLGMGECHETRVEAVTDVLLARTPRRNGAEILPQEVLLIQQQVQRARCHILMLGRQSVKERVANFLLQLAERAGDGLEDGAALELPMGRQDIADYLGLTLETVCRTIGSLKRDRLIDVPDTHRIVIRRAELLEDLARSEA